MSARLSGRAVVSVRDVCRMRSRARALVARHGLLSGLTPMTPGRRGSDHRLRRSVMLWLVPRG